MSDRLHLELDAVSEFLVDEAGQRIAIDVDQPLKPANQRLMDFLGVEVRVTATAGGVSCLVGGCEWRFDGDYDDRQAAIEKHREEEHDYIPAHRFSVRSDAGRDALDAMDSLLTQREHLDVDDQADDEEDVDEEDTGLEAELDEVGGAEVGNREEDAAASTSPGGEETASAGQHGRSRAARVRVGAPDRSSWSRKKIEPAVAIAALRAAADELGHTPRESEWNKSKRRPGSATFGRLFGGWLEACTAAELDPPSELDSRGRRNRGFARRREPDASSLVDSSQLSESSVREPQAREAAVSPPPADVKQPGATGDAAVRGESPGQPLVEAEAGSSTDEPPTAELLDMRTLVDEPGEWIHRLEAEGDRLLAESDRLAHRAEGVHAIVHGLRIVQETDR